MVCKVKSQNVLATNLSKPNATLHNLISEILQKRNEKKEQRKRTFSGTSLIDLHSN